MKKILAIALVIALLSIMAIGTTLSYFKDTAYNKNVMTVGTVTIVQKEDFTPNTALRPYIGTPVADTNGLWDTSKNAVTKTVTVQNTGSESAYIRTLFAFEAYNGDPIANQKIHANFTDAGTVACMGTVKVGNVDYVVYSFTYNSVIGGNTDAGASLKQIALDCSVGNEFYTAVGTQYDVLVVSQAVQSTGFAATDTKSAVEVAFESAFGALDADWFK